MTASEIAKKFLEKKYQLNMGAGNLAKRYKVKRDEIYKAKELARAEIDKDKVIPKLPKILIFDIETSPLKAYVWTRWQQNVYPDQMLTDWFMLTWSAKWLFDETVMSAKLTPEEVKNEDDKRITELIWKLIDEADIIVAHNGDRFDIPRLNSRFIVNGLSPTSTIKSIDTKKVASRQFGFSSNKLSELAKVFGFDGKLDTDFELWAKCMDGDQEALNYMQQYNDQDVILLEEVYLKLRPWIKTHPNVALYMELDEPVCTNCGSKNLTYMNKYYYTMTGKFETYRCKCGAIGRRRLNSFDKSKKENLLIPIGQ